MHIKKSAVIKAMKNKNIQTQSELAERMGMSRSQLSQMLSEDFNPIKNNVINLINVLNIDLEDIISIESNKVDKIKESVEVYNKNPKFKQLDFFETTNINRLDYKLDEFTDVNNLQSSKKFNVLETFAGAGGLALGLELSGFNTLGAIEIDSTAVKTLKINRPHWNIVKGDINKIADKGLVNSGVIEKINEIDVLSGGYPCQTFSYAGLRRGLKDIRGTLFYPFSQILSEIQPKVFIAENVKGLVNHDNGKTLETMISVFENLNYSIYWNVLNAWDYDVAQKRERIVIVGIRNDLVAKEKYSYKFPKPLINKPLLKDVLKDVPESQGVKYSEKKEKVLKLVPPGGCWVNLPDEIAKEYLGASYYSGGGRRGMARRMSWNEPSLTLTTSPSQKQTERCHPEEIRPFTVREYARIQSFPDNWIFEGGIGAQYKQIGNAVPVNLAKYVGLSVVKYLNQFDELVEGV